MVDSSVHIRLLAVTTHCRHHTTAVYQQQQHNYNNTVECVCVCVLCAQIAYIRFVTYPSRSGGGGGVAVSNSKSDQVQVLLRDMIC